MKTTNTATLLDMLRGLVVLATSGVLQMQQSKDDLTAEADWLYANLLQAGATPAEIAAAVPGVSVFA